MHQSQEYARRGQRQIPQFAIKIFTVLNFSNWNNKTWDIHHEQDK